MAPGRLLLTVALVGVLAAGPALGLLAAVPAASPPAPAVFPPVHAQPPPSHLALTLFDAYTADATGLATYALSAASRDEVLRRGAVLRSTVATSSAADSIKVRATSDATEHRLKGASEFLAKAAHVPVAEMPTEGAAPMMLIVSLSQETIALLGLAPQPGVGPQVPTPTQLAPHGGIAPRVALAAASNLGVEAPGWLQQAAWTVALAAFGLAAARGLGLVVLLFSRFARDEVLANDRRNQLHEAIRAEPGITFGRLAQRFDLAVGSAQHHLRQLERHGLVRRVRDGRTSHYYIAGPRFAHPAALAPARRQLLEVLAGFPGLTTKQLADRAGHRVQSVWEHLARLRSHGMVQTARHGRTLVWSAAAATA